jgi:hypothetical protein
VQWINYWNQYTRNLGAYFKGISLYKVGGHPTISKATSFERYAILTSSFACNSTSDFDRATLLKVIILEKSLISRKPRLLTLGLANVDYASPFDDMGIIMHAIQAVI